MGIESDSAVTQTRYSISKHHFLAFYNGIYVCEDIESTQQPHKHNIPLQNTIFQRFAMEYMICMGIESTQQSHKQDILLQNTIVFTFYYGIYDLCWYRVGVKRPTNTIFHQKTPIFQCFVMEYTIFVGIESTQQPYKHNIPFHTIFLSFYNGIYVLCGY